MSTGDNAKVGLGSSFNIGFQRYTSVMAWFDLAAMTASLSVLMLYFRRSIPSRYELAQLKPQHEAIRDMGTFRTGWAVLALLVFGFFGLEPLGVRVSAVAAVGALLLIVAGCGHITSTRKVLRGAPGRLSFSLWVCTWWCMACAMPG